jgi:GT2 family glycosyltransferase
MISIVIPCFNHLDLTVGLLNSFVGNTFHEYEIILIDDCSSDRTQLLKEKDFGIDALIRHSTNQGFPRSVNDGINATTGEYVAIFNNDVEVKSNWDAPLVAALEKHPTLGMVMGKCFNSEKEYYSTQTNQIKVWNRGLPFFLKRKTQLEIGLWDERYFPSWFDDIDMEIRLVSAGYSFGVAEDSSCIHFGSQTIGKIEPGWEDYKEISANKFQEKWGLKNASAFINFKKLLITGELQVSDWEEYTRMVYTIEGGMSY